MNWSTRRMALVRHGNKLQVEMYPQVAISMNFKRPVMARKSEMHDVHYRVTIKPPSPHGR